MKMKDLTENGGRIVKGVNTTVDVGTDEISKQAKKFGNSVDKDGFPPTMSTVVKPKKTTVKEGYRLRLERDKSANMLVLHIKDTRTGRRSEVRGKLGYETDGYDPNDKLHQLLDKVGRSASVSDMMNGDVVHINPRHPQGPSATKAASAITAETILEKLGEIAPNTEIYVDMDGVLADFFGEWAKAMGKKSFRDIEDPEAAIGKIKDIKDFWLNLPVLPQAKQLLTLIKKVKGKYKICTSPLADDPRSEPHKREWVKKNLAFFPPEEVIVTHNKPKWATQKDGTPNILIDDYGVNINNWEAAGGIGFKYKDHKFERTVKAIKQAVGENPANKPTTTTEFNESDVPLGKYLFHVTYASGLTGMLRDGHLGEPDEYFSMTADPKYVVSGNPEVQIVIDTARVSKMETFEKHVEDWESTPGAGDWAKGDDGDFESEYRVEETIPWNYVVAVKILKSKATPEIIKLAKKRGVKLVGKDNNVTENVAYNESTDLNSLRKFVRSQREAPDQVLYQMMMAPDTYGHSASNFVRSWYEKTKEENGLNDVDSALEIMVDELGLNENFNEGITTIDLKNALEKISKNATNGERLVDVFIMRYQHNMTFKQIGDEIGTSIDRARQVYLRAERMIRKSLQDYDPKVKENFADGKKKGKSRPGRVKRSGASCNGSVTSLRKKAKAGGEKGRMYHWCANMKSGRKKK